MRFFTSLTVLFVAFLLNAVPGYGLEDLKISVTASHVNANPGDEITYVIKYSNAGVTPASNVIITSQLPKMGAYTYVSSYPQGNISGNVITWNSLQIPGLALLGNEEHEITVTIKAGVPGDGTTLSSAGYYIPPGPLTLSTYATIKSDGTVADVQSLTASTIVQQVGNALVNNASGCIKSATHSIVYYLMQLKNTGNVYDRYELTSLNYDCDGPGGKGFDPLEAAFTDLSGSSLTTTEWIAPGQTYFFYLQLTAVTGTNPKNFSCHDVIATSAVNNVVATGNTQTSIEGSPNIPYPDLSIVKTAVSSSTPTTKGSSITYTLNYENSGTMDALGVQIIDMFDDLHVNITDAGSGTVSGNEISWNLGSLAPGQSGSLSYTVLVDPSAYYIAGTTNIPNMAVISSIGIESNYKYNRATCTVPVTVLPDVAIVVSSENAVLETDKENMYTIRVTNMGNVAAPNVVIKDKLPEGIPIGSISNGGTVSGEEITWPIISLFEAGAFIEYTVKVIPSCSEMPAITNVATVISSVTDLDETNNSSTLLSTVLDKIKPALKDVPIDVTVSCDAIPQAGTPSATDNCDATPEVHFLGETSTKGNDPLLSDYYNYIITRTWDATDDWGNHSDPASQTITVKDGTLPAIPVLADITSECSASPEAPTTNDNCGGTITGTTLTSFPINTQGTTIIEWTFKDQTGNISTASQKVIIQDITPPKVPVLADVTVGECSGTPQVPTTTDNCAGTITGTTTTPFPITAQGTTVVEWTFDDGNGNQITAKQNIIVDDITPPVMPVLTDITLGECSGTPQAPTTTDNCAGTITGTTTTLFPITTQGATIIEWTFDDSNGNKTTASQKVIIDDTTAPEAPILADVILGDCNNTPVTPTTMDNCAGIVTGTTTASFPLDTPGTTVVTWTFDDGNGNNTTASQKVIVNDITPPVVPVLPDVTVGECSGTPQAPIIIDKCAGAILGTTTTPFPITKQGTTVVEWTFDDGNGNQITAKQNIIVDDITPPVTPVLADVIIGECIGTPEAPITFDSCTGTVVGTTPTRFPINMHGSTVVEWTFNDGNGNQTTAYQNVIIKDTTPPVVPALPSITLGECGGTPQIPTTTDNCTGTIIGTTTTLFPITKQGLNAVEWTFDDGHGNTSTVLQNVIVEDITPPVAPLLADVTVGECSGTPSAPTTTDNCAGTITGTTTTLFPITTQGTTIVEWTFDDGHGNTSTALQNVIVDDVTPPVLPALADVTVGECSGTPQTPTTTDNCAGTITGITTTQFPITTQGTTVVTWTFNDDNGNTTTAIQNVIVKDVTSPQITGTIATTTMEGCTAADVVPFVTTVAELEALGLSIADNCAPDNELLVTHSDASESVAPVVITRTYTISDPSGNTSNCIHSIMVVDSQDPVITCASPLDSYQADNGKCSYTVLGTGLDPIVTSDNCAVKSVINDFTNTSSLKDAVFPLGKTNVTWTVEDMSGNTSSSAYEVMVIDTQNPTISCAVPAISYPSDPGVCNYKVLGTDLDPFATSDNCSVKSVTNNFTNTSSLKDALFPLGTTLVKWTVEDMSGNKTSCSYNIVVIDKQAPVITCPTPAASYTYNTFGTELDPVASDNCSIASIKNDFNNSASLANAVFPVGTTVVTWTATDESGNVNTCSYSILIIDTQPPVINCAFMPEDGYVTDPESNVYKVQGTALDPTADDNYSEVSLTNDFNNNASLLNVQFPVGQTTVVWTATDKSGNSSSCTQIVQVRDLQNPTITCPADINRIADPGECSASIPELGVSITSDNCSVASVSNDAPSVFPAGITKVTWTATDASGNIATCTQTVTVYGTPKAVDDHLSLNEDSQLSGNVMTNDEGCKVTIAIQAHSEPTHGSLIIADDGSYTYIPDENYFGEDSFTYKACSANGDCSEATVYITVESVDDLPQAVNDDQKLELDLVLEGNVATNDLISGDGGNVWSLVDSPSHGTIDFHQDGTYSYSATTDFLGSDSFTYQVCDQDGDCSQATVSIIIEDILLPNQILSPNGDLINDTFIIEGINLYPDNKLTIYNRWGNIVYRKNNYQNEWDGAANGNKVGSQPLPVGTYYYLIDYGKNRHKTGFVYLDR